MILSLTYEGASEPDSTATDIVVDKAFDPELQDIFLTEAEDVLATLAQNLQALRVMPQTVLP